MSLGSIARPRLYNLRNFSHITKLELHFSSIASVSFSKYMKLLPTSSRQETSISTTYTLLTTSARSTTYYTPFSSISLQSPISFDIKTLRPLRAINPQISRFLQVSFTIFTTCLSIAKFGTFLNQAQPGSHSRSSWYPKCGGTCQT